MCTVTLGTVKGATSSNQNDGFRQETKTWTSSVLNLVFPLDVKMTENYMLYNLAGK